MHRLTVCRDQEKALSSDVTDGLVNREKPNKDEEAHEEQPKRSTEKSAVRSSSTVLFCSNLVILSGSRSWWFHILFRTTKKKRKHRRRLTDFCSFSNSFFLCLRCSVWFPCHILFFYISSLIIFLLLLGLPATTMPSSRWIVNWREWEDASIRWNVWCKTGWIQSWWDSFIKSISVPGMYMNYAWKSTYFCVTFRVNEIISLHLNECFFLKNIVNFKLL